MNFHEKIAMRVERDNLLSERLSSIALVDEFYQLQNDEKVARYLELSSKINLLHEKANESNESLILRARDKVRVDKPVNVYFYKGTYKLNRVRRGAFQCLDTLVDRDSEEADISKYENLENKDITYEIVLEARDEFEKNNIIIYAPEANFDAIRAKYYDILLWDGDEKALKYITGNFEKPYSMAY